MSNFDLSKLVGKCVILIGGKGTGKSVWAKQQLKKYPKNRRFVFDPNQEHLELYDQRFVPFDVFRKIGMQLKNSIIFIDEASIELAYKIVDDDVKDFIVRLRHTKSNAIFAFHGIRFVPPFLLVLADYIVIFKTNDGEKYLKSKIEDDRFLEAYKRVKAADWIQGETKPYSPHEVYDVYLMDTKNGS